MIRPSLSEARADFMRANGLDEAGWTAPWISLPAGRFHFWFPNTRERRRLVPLHDAHHALGEYGTDWVGEGEVGAWELASGCSFSWTAVALNSAALGMGAIRDWRRCWAAYQRGLGCTNLYNREEPVLDKSVEHVREILGFGSSSPAPRWLDRLRFVVLASAGAASMWPVEILERVAPRPD